MAVVGKVISAPQQACFDLPAFHMFPAAMPFGPVDTMNNSMNSMNNSMNSMNNSMNSMNMGASLNTGMPMHTAYSVPMQRKQQMGRHIEDDMADRYPYGRMHSHYALPQAHAEAHFAPSRSSGSFYSSSHSSNSLQQYQSHDYGEQSQGCHTPGSAWAFETSKISVSTPVEQALADDSESCCERGRSLEPTQTPSSRSRSATSSSSSEEVEMPCRPRSQSQPPAHIE